MKPGRLAPNVEVLDAVDRLGHASLGVDARRRAREPDCRGVDLADPAGEVSGRLRLDVGGTIDVGLPGKRRMSGCPFPESSDAGTAGESDFVVDAGLVHETDACVRQQPASSATGDRRVTLKGP